MRNLERKPPYRQIFLDMILKFKQGSDGGAWRFIDGITQVDILPNFKKDDFFQGTVAAIQYCTKTEVLTQAFDNEAYLLNDEGKTIQRLTYFSNGKVHPTL